MLVPELKELLQYWRERYGTQDLPPRPLLSQDQLEPWTRHLAWIELTGDDSLIIRRFGYDLTRRYGREATGEMVDDLAPDIASSLREVIWRVAAAKAPVSSTASVALGRDAAIFSELGLPMARMDGQVNLIVIASYEIIRPQAARR